MCYICSAVVTAGPGVPSSGSFRPIADIRPTCSKATMQNANLVSLETIRTRIEHLAAEIDAPATYLPTFGNSRHDGSHHIELDRLYNWVVCERGSELQRRSTADLDELLFWVFSTVTFSMAVDFELAHRRSREDFRRQLFQKQEELLSKLSQPLADREARDHQAILQRNPFRDG